MIINFRKKGVARYTSNDVYSISRMHVNIIQYTIPSSWFSVCRTPVPRVHHHGMGEKSFVSVDYVHDQGLFVNSEVTVFISNFATPEFVRALCENELKEVVDYVC